MRIQTSRTAKDEVNLDIFCACPENGSSGKFIGGMLHLKSRTAHASGTITRQSQLLSCSGEIPMGSSTYQVAEPLDGSVTGFRLARHHRSF